MPDPCVETVAIDIADVCCEAAGGHIVCRVRTMIVTRSGASWSMCLFIKHM